LPPDPLILAFDTSAAHCAAALVSGADVLAQTREDMAKGQAERLFPLLEDLLASVDKSWADLQIIGVCTGPGNFTGVRIGVSSARGLALSLGIPAIGVSALEALGFGQTGPSTSLVDARRGRVYRQEYRDGIATGLPAQCDASDLVRSAKLIADSDLAGLENTSPPAQTRVVGVAAIALSRLGLDNPRPAPLYLRAPNAALPSDPPPVILP